MGATWGASFFLGAMGFFGSGFFLAVSTLFRRSIFDEYYLVVSMDERSPVSILAFACNLEERISEFYFEMEPWPKAILERFNTEEEVLLLS